MAMLTNKSKENSMKEILISDPAKVLRFYQNEKRDNVIYDSHYPQMIAINKMEPDYVIPIEKETRHKTASFNTPVNIIDPNKAAVNQARENLKSDVVDKKASVIHVTSRPINITEKRKPDTSEESSCSKTKKPRSKRRKTIVNGDIFAE